MLLFICCFGVIRSCPFAGLSLSNDECLKHHSKDTCEKLLNQLNFPSQLQNNALSRSSRKLLESSQIPPLPYPDISQRNNAIVTGPLLSQYASGYDFVDIVSAFSAGLLGDSLGLPPAGTLGKDMCIWNFQALTPPPGSDNKYHIPLQDAPKALQLCKSANDLFQNEVGLGKNDGSVVFGGCTIGSSGARDVCKFNFGADTNSTFCNPAANASTVNWPQAVTMFRVRAFNTTAPPQSNNAALKTFITNWRSLSSFHLPHITWVFQGGSGSADGAYYAGWGAGSGANGGGLVRKVVPCDAISSKYMYPAATAVDHPNADGTKTVMAEAYEYWQSLCSVLPWPVAAQPGCTFTYPGTTPAPVTTPAPPPADPNSPASCATYTQDQIACAQKVTPFGFSSAQQALDKQLTAGLMACAQTMCAGWPGGGTVVQV